MVRAVGNHRSQDLADRTDAAFARGFQAFEHDGRCSHADDQAMAPAIERSGRFFDDFVCRGGAGSEEAGTEPSHQVVRGDVVRGNDDHPAAAAGADPVAGERDRLRAAGACAVGRRVRAARADVFGKLRMAHGEHSEQEPAVEMVCVLFDLLAQRVHALFDFLGDAVAAAGALRYGI